MNKREGLDKSHNPVKIRRIWGERKKKSREVKMTRPEARWKEGGEGNCLAGREKEAATAAGWTLHQSGRGEQLKLQFENIMNDYTTLRPFKREPASEQRQKQAETSEYKWALSVRAGSNRALSQRQGSGCQTSRAAYPFGKNTHIHAYLHTYIRAYMHTYETSYAKCRVCLLHTCMAS